MKKYLIAISALVLAAVFLASTRTAYADVLYEHRYREERQGVVYERVRQMTTYGMLDIHMLRVPLNDPNIYIGPVVSQQAHGRRETTTNLLSSADAVAGINADFFGMAGQYTVHFGPMVMDGQVMGLNTNTNHTNNEFATFFLDADNTPFFEYIRQTVRFYNNGHRNVNVAAFNVIGNDIRFPVIIDRQIMYDTQPLRERFRGLQKVVVSGNEIVQITHRAVTIPEDGYVLIIPYEMTEYLLHYFNVGDTARLRFTNNLGIDFAGLQAAIGGGGMILSERQTVYGAGVQPNARHPRSAIGATRDGNTLILMVVDGRNDSIGATHNEMASLMRLFGAWDAMHFDGGGSSTLVARDWSGRYEVINTPSDGGQRRIINALGVFDNRSLRELQAYRPYVPTPQLAQLIANPASINLLEGGQEVRLRFSGISTDGANIPNIPLSYVSDIAVVSHYNIGVVEDGVFIAHGSGNGYIAVTAHGIRTYIPVTIGGGARNLYVHRSRLRFLGHPVDYASGDVSVDGRNITMNYRFSGRFNGTQTANMTIYPPLALPRYTIGLNLRVTGNGSGHWLRGRVRDANGQFHNIDFAQSVNFTTRETVTATLPTDAPGPFTIDRIYMVTLSVQESARFTIHFGALEAIVAHAPYPNVPRGPVFRDPLWAVGGFDGGTSFDLPNRDYDVEYSFERRGRFSVVTMSLDGGRLGTRQWRYFMPDILSNNSDYVVILLDNNPLTAIRNSAERELFHMAMRDLTDEGRRVFVVSATAGRTTVAINNGVRYINLARNSESIRFNTYGDEIRWAD